MWSRRRRETSSETEKGKQEDVRERREDGEGEKTDKTKIDICYEAKGK